MALVRASILNGITIILQCVQTMFKSPFLGLLLGSICFYCENSTQPLQLYQVPISPTFYECLFRTKVLPEAFLNLQFRFFCARLPGANVLIKRW